MPEDTDNIFDLPATDADNTRRRLVPYLDAMHRTILDLLPEHQGDGPLRILDLGPGTGLLAERILRRHETAEVTLVDLSEPALANIRERLQAFGERVRLETGDYAHMTFDAPYDAIVAEISVHHLNKKTMRTLFSASYAALRRGGVFINADQVRGETETVEAEQVAAWRADALRIGAGEGDIDEAIELHTTNRPPTLQIITETMSDDGYENVYCAYKQWGFVVLSGEKV